MSTRSPAAVSRATVWRYASGSLATGGFSTLPGLVLLYYCTDTLAIPAAVAGLVIGIVKIWDVIVDPLIGALSDADERRTGARRRFLAIGAVVLPLCFVAIFAVPEGLPVPAAALWVGIAYLLAATAFSIFQVPYIALPAAIASDYDQRTRLLTARVVVLSAAILIFGGGGPALRSLADGASGYLLMAIVCAVLLLASGVFAVGSAPRQQHDTVVLAERRPVRDAYRDAWRVLSGGGALRKLVAPFFLQAVATGIMLGTSQYVAAQILHSEDAVTLLFVALIAPAILAAPVWQIVSARSSKRFAFQLASALFAAAAIGLIPALLAPSLLILLPVAIAGIAYAGMQSLPMAMLPDVMAEDRRAFGLDRSGVIGGVWTAAETTGFALGGILVSIALAASGYVSSSGGAVQPTSAVIAIGVCFSLAPAVLVLASLLPLRAYPLTRAVVDAHAGEPEKDLHG